MRLAPIALAVLAVPWSVTFCMTFYSARAQQHCWRSLPGPKHLKADVSLMNMPHTWGKTFFSTRRNRLNLTLALQCYGYVRVLP